MNALTGADLCRLVFYLMIKQIVSLQAQKAESVGLPITHVPGFSRLSTSQASHAQEATSGVTM